MDRRSKLSAGLGRRNDGFSNKRERELTVTETLLRGALVCIFSRMASGVSTRDRGSVVAIVRGVTGVGAIVLVSRELRGIMNDSGVLLLSGNGVRRDNARFRLVSLGGGCGLVCSARTRLRGCTGRRTW